MIAVDCTFGANAVMLTYSHTNSSIDEPLLSEQQLKILEMVRSLRSQEKGRYLAQDLQRVAERLRCEDVAARLRNYNVMAACPHRPNRNYVPATIHIEMEEHAEEPFVSANAEFGERLLDRLKSGLAPIDAFRRTLADAHKPTMSGREIEALERAVKIEMRANIQRRLDAGEITSQDAALEMRGTV